MEEAAAAQEAEAAAAAAEAQARNAVAAAEAVIAEAAASKAEPPSIHTTTTRFARRERKRLLTFIYDLFMIYF